MTLTWFIGDIGREYWGFTAIVSNFSNFDGTNHDVHK